GPERPRDRFPHITESLPQGYSSSWPFWIERYVKRHARIVLHLRMILGQGEMVDLCAIWERKPTSSASQSCGRVGARMSQHLKLNINTSGDEIEDVVFVLNTKLLKKPRWCHY